MSENSVKTVYLIISGHPAVPWESNRTQPFEILDPPKQTMVLQNSDTTLVLINRMCYYYASVTSHKFNI